MTRREWRRVTLISHATHRPLRCIRLFKQAAARQVVWKVIVIDWPGSVPSLEPWAGDDDAEDRPERWKALNHTIAVNRLPGFAPGLRACRLELSQIVLRVAQACNRLRPDPRSAARRHRRACQRRSGWLRCLPVRHRAGVSREATTSRSAIDAPHHAGRACKAHLCECQESQSGGRSTG
jgi:hypothetical protein